MRFAMPLSFAAVAGLLSIAAVVGCSSSSALESAPTPQTVRVTGGANPTGTITMGVTATPTSVRSATLSASVTDAWHALPSAYESLSIPLSVVDSATRRLGNSSFNVRRRLGTVPLVRLIDCGSTQGGPSAESYDINMSVLSRLTAGEGSTTISTTVEAMGKPVAFSGEYIRCSSTGVLESRIADAVKARLASR